MPFLIPVVAWVGANAGAIMAVTSVAATVASGAQQAKAQRQQAAIAEQTANYNAKVQENQSIQADMEARAQIERDRASGERFLGSQRAAIAGSGVTTAGSPLEVLGETAGLLELGALDSARQAESARRLGFNSAAMTRASGANLASGYRAQATGTILSTIGSAAGSAYRLNDAGAFKFKSGGG